MRFTNLTQATEIGANSYLLEIGGKRIVLDCGMHPKYDGEAALPNFIPLPDRSVDAVLLSHSHLDHIGSLPVLMRRQPQAPVFMTQPTARLGDRLLHNSVNVMSRQLPGGNGAPGPERGRPSGMLFTHREADSAAQTWRDCPLRQPFAFDGERLPRGGTEHAELSFEFFDAGHILGSAGIMLREGGRRIFYTGDVNFIDQTISRAAAFPEEEPVDVLIVETTRGDNPAAANFKRSEEEARLARALRAAFERGGAVLIPVFALGKTQELLAMLLDFRKRGLLLTSVPIYIGGLSTKMTEIYDHYALQAPRRKAMTGVQLLTTVAPYVLSGRDAADAPIKPGRIYALSSGMMTEGTLSNVYARRMMSDPRHSIFFVGYADPESPAGRMRAASPGDLVSLDAEGFTEGSGPGFPLRCNVEKFDFSAHADRETIRAYVRRVAPKKVILVHGDVGAVGWFQKTLSADLPRTEVIIPPPGTAIEV